MLLLQIFIIASLLLLVIQDFKSRFVYWLVFPALVLEFILWHYLQQQSLKEIWQSILFNVLFLLLQLLLITIYFSLKSKRLINITSELLGLGDILFLLSMAFYFSVLNFMAFYLISLIESLITWLLWLTLTKHKNKHIPLAGIQALFLIIFLTLDWWILHFNIANDDWLLRLIKI